MTRLLMRNTFITSFLKGQINYKRWVLTSTFILLAVMIGGAIGLNPYLAAPVILIIAVAATLAGGIRFASKTLKDAKSWEPYALFIFWAMVVNVPTFLSFDQTGFTKEHGLFNAQSLSRIFIFCLSTLCSIYFWIQIKRSSAHRQKLAGSTILFSLYIWYLSLAPITAAGAAMALSVFRALEWLSAFFLLALLMKWQNSRGFTGIKHRLSIVFPMLWFICGATILQFTISPASAYQISTITGYGRLGSIFAHPNLLAIVSIILFVYSAAFFNRWKRVLTCAVLLLMLVATYSRGGYFAAAFLLIAAVFIFTRGIAAASIICVMVFVGTIALQFPDIASQANKILARGNEKEGLTTLSERTAVWEAAKIMIRRSPIFGEGFISGPKELGEVMSRNRLSNNFSAPHAHNEFLQAQISGGLLATALSLLIHLRIAVLLWRRRLDMERRELFLLISVFVCCCVWGLLGPSLSYFLSLCGTLLGWLLLSLENMGSPNHHRTRKAFSTVSTQ